MADSNARKRFRQRQRDAQDAAMGRPRPDRCEVCNEAGYWRGRSPHIVFDHCHATGKPRGWLCDRCNKLLGLVKDNPVLLRKLTAYLEHHHGEAHDKTAKVVTIQGLRASGA